MDIMLTSFKYSYDSLVFRGEAMDLGEINLDTLVFIIVGFLAFRTLIKDYIVK